MFPVTPTVEHARAVFPTVEQVIVAFPTVDDRLEQCSQLSMRSDSTLSCPQLLVTVPVRNIPEQLVMPNVLQVPAGSEHGGRVSGG
jgi:hypothetical protein